MSIRFDEPLELLFDQVDGHRNAEGCVSLQDHIPMIDIAQFRDRFITSIQKVVRKDLKNFCAGVAPEQVCQSRSVGRANRLGLAKKTYLLLEEKILQVGNRPVSLLEKTNYLCLDLSTRVFFPFS